MVTRKPVSRSTDSNLTANLYSPPYPVTPIATNVSPNFRMQDVHNELRSATEYEPDSANAWSGEGLDEQIDGSSQSKRTRQNNIPDSLRVGPPGYTPRSSQDMLRPSATTTNPYLKTQQDAQSERSASAWGGFPERPAPSANTPPPPPLSKDIPPPTQQFFNLAVSEPSNNPWQPALNKKAPSQHPPPIPQMQRQDSGNEAWSAAPPAREALSAPAPLETSQQPLLVDIDEAESPAWDEDDDDEPSPVIHELPAETVQETQQMDEERTAWNETDGQGLNQEAATSHFVAQEDPTQQSEGWNIVDHESATSNHQESGIVGADGTILESHVEEDHTPALPPRRSQEQQPPRSILGMANASTSSIITSGTPASAIRTQKKETYEIKKITWHDVTAAENPRVSPILVQNANGPCPLLALVNALTLSIPANVETALVETLRSREQVSLGLLLDAVFDELMSGRRGDAAQELPDVSDLYSFLITLHTGMNVNPRFFPPDPANKRYSNDPRNSMSHIHPTERDSSIPGTFEDTREMKLYSTFSTPLIHGWLPERDSPAYTALSRSAKSYEDAQNLMFHEEELEDKLQREGLSFEEQATLEDIATIKAFFNTAATQLTPYGLDTITNSLAPGAVAILFRNDHFSTLYRHPDTLQLLQLVTDMGYAGHEEVVWESLIDVNGENAEFFSGDFRLVGGAPQTPSASQPQSQSDAGGWTTIAGRRASSLQTHPQGQVANTPSHSHAKPIQETPQSPNIEQEDHDLALALQLQEEEEERHRNEIARRRRETELSQQYIEQQGASGGSGVNIPVNVHGGRGPNSRGLQHGSSGPTHGATELRPEIPPRRSGPGAGGQPVDPEAGVDAPPPSYEQAANQAAYVPPTDHPAHPNASPNVRGKSQGRGRRLSAYSANAQNLAGVGSSASNPRSGRRATGPTQIQGRRQSQGLSQQQQNEREKDCVVM